MSGHFSHVGKGSDETGEAKKAKRVKKAKTLASIIGRITCYLLSAFY
jgi:hypothetical protein